MSDHFKAIRDTDDGKHKEPAKYCAAVAKALNEVKDFVDNRTIELFNKLKFFHYGEYEKQKAEIVRLDSILHNILVNVRQISDGMKNAQDKPKQTDEQKIPMSKQQEIPLQAIDLQKQKDDTFIAKWGFPKELCIDIGGWQRFKRQHGRSGGTLRKQWIYRLGDLAQFKNEEELVSTRKKIGKATLDLIRDIMRANNVKFDSYVEVWRKSHTHDYGTAQELLADAKKAGLSSKLVQPGYQENKYTK